MSSGRKRNRGGKGKKSPGSGSKIPTNTPTPFPTPKSAAKPTTKSIFDDPLLDDPNAKPMLRLKTTLLRTYKTHGDKFTTEQKDYLDDLAKNKRYEKGISLATLRNDDKFKAAFGEMGVVGKNFTALKFQNYYDNTEIGEIPGVELTDEQIKKKAEEKADDVQRRLGPLMLGADTPSTPSPGVRNDELKNVSYTFPLGGGYPGTPLSGYGGMMPSLNNDDVKIERQNVRADRTNINANDVNIDAQSININADMGLIPDDALASIDRSENHLQRIQDAVEQQVVNASGRDEDATGRPEGVAAGTSSLGNPMQYDFVTATGRGSGGGGGTNDINMHVGGQPDEKSARDAFKLRAGENINALDKDGDRKVEGGITEFLDKLNASAKDKYDGDEILGPKTLDRSRASMRPEYRQGGSQNLERSPAERIAMDVNFDMFDFVPDGFGLGDDNKMFVMEQGRDKNVVYREPMYLPRRPDDIENNGIEPVDKRLDTPKKPSQIVGKLIQTMEEAALQMRTHLQQGVKSVQALPGDNVNEKSSKGLKANEPSPFEFVINNNSPFIPVYDPAGVNMKRKFKSLYSAQRFPMRPTEYNPNNGFPTLSKRRAMEIILP